jgi:hypothetical protein
MVQFGDWMAILALAVSAASFGFNFWFNYVKARIDRQPVLSFVDTGEIWELRNIGNGAALNVIVQKKYVSGGRAGMWNEPVQIPDLGKDKKFPLHWLGRINDVGLGATYRDTTGRLYGTRVGNDRNVTAPLRTRKRPAELKGLREPSPDARVTAHWRAAP